MPYALAVAPGALYAGLNDGRIYASNDRGDTWHMLPLSGDTLLRITALARVA